MDCPDEPYELTTGHRQLATKENGERLFGHLPSLSDQVCN